MPTLIVSKKYALSIEYDDFVACDCKVCQKNKNHYFNAIKRHMQVANFLDAHPVIAAYYETGMVQYFDVLKMAGG